MPIQKNASDFFKLREELTQMKELSFQLYSAREFPPIEKTFKLLSDLGYTQVETFGAQYANPQSIADLSQEFNLKIPTGHFGLPQLESEFESVVQISKRLGVSLVVCPFLDVNRRPNDSAGWCEFGKQLESIAKELSTHNLEFAWHNHDFEFKELPTGEIPMNLILDSAPSIKWEADIAWIVRADVDPVSSINQYQNQIEAVHIKDIAKTGECEDEDGWADVGHGTMDWNMLLKLLSSSNTKYFIVEHDKPSDVARFAKRSIEYLKSLES